MEQHVSSSQVQITFSLRLSSIIEELNLFMIHTKVKRLLGNEPVLQKIPEGMKHTRGGGHHIHMLQ